MDDCFYLQKLLALYFAIIYSWQLSSSEKSFSREKQFIYVSQGFYRFRFLFFHFFSFCSFCLTNTCLPCQLRKAYVPWAANRFVVWRHLNTMILTNFENLSSISNIFQETQFLSFVRPSNYLHLFKNHRQTFSWPGERP